MFFFKSKFVIDVSSVADRYHFCSDPDSILDLDKDKNPVEISRWDPLPDPDPGGITQGSEYDHD